MKRSNTLLSVVFVLAVMVLTITFSIGLPIYVRPFYYAHVDALGLAEKWGVEREDIIEAYDEVLDFLTKDDCEFGTGFLPYSEDGKSHFEDCKVLFDLNKNAFIVSLAVILFLLMLDKMGKIRLATPFGLPLSFFAGLLTLLLFGALAAVIARDFASAFIVFHKIFFPGKINWGFHPYKDPIILFLPRQFFMDCAILICTSVITISVAFMIRGKRRKGII